MSAAPVLLCGVHARLTRAALRDRSARSSQKRKADSSLENTAKLSATVRLLGAAQKNYEESVAYIDHLQQRLVAAERELAMERNASDIERRFKALGVAPAMAVWQAHEAGIRGGVVGAKRVCGELRRMVLPEFSDRYRLHVLGPPLYKHLQEVLGDDGMRNQPFLVSPEAYQAPAK